MQKNVIFRAWRRLPNGAVLWARQYGLRAWPIPVDEITIEDEKTAPIKDTV